MRLRIAAVAVSSSSGSASAASTARAWRAASAAVARTSAAVGSVTNPAWAATRLVTSAVGARDTTPGRLYLRCPLCQRFAWMLPSDTACASCAERLPLTFPVTGGDR